MKKSNQHISNLINHKIGLSTILLLIHAITLFGQSNFTVINKIEIGGNKKTKERIVLRELDFEVGDTLHIDQISKVIERNEANLINTGLFTKAKINIKEWETKAQTLTMYIDLQEIFYIIPVPIFELADRNFSVWWTDQKRSFSRVNYGARVYHNNLSGNQDRLKLVAQFGYTKKYEVVYSQPYINKKQTIGFSTGILYATQNNLPYLTQNNKRLFADVEDLKLLTRFSVRLGATYRPNYYGYQDFKIEYQSNKVPSSVIDTLNQAFFKDNKGEQKLFSLTYILSRDNRNIKVFPTKGNRSELILFKQGLGIFNDINLMSIELKHERFTTLSKKWTLMTSLKGKAELTGNRPPYYQNRGLGFGQDYIRGYELYVLDGQYYAYIRSGLRFNVVETSANLKKLMPLRQMRYLPINLYVDVHFDSGIVHDRFYADNNPLTNNWLAGYGLGLDLLLYNNYLFELDMTVNRLGEVGFYFQYNVDF